MPASTRRRTASTPSIDEPLGGGSTGGLVAGVVGGVVVVALLAGSITLVLMLLAGAVVGGLVAGGAILAVDAARGRTHESGDHPAPTLDGDTGPDAQRSEAGHTSPST